MIRIYDRQRAQMTEEKVYGGGIISWAYGSGLGRRVVLSGAFQRLLSRWVGRFQGHRVSLPNVEKFIREFDIRMEDFQTPAEGFANFNDFFVRKLRPGARAFPTERSELGSPAEGRLSVFALTQSSVPLVIKGRELSLARLVDSESIAQKLVGGFAFVFRLCPVDYHRFHFPDAGMPGESRMIAGLLHSVNPASLGSVPEVFLENERRICHFQSQNFGELYLMEVGAMCVGRIHQSYEPGVAVVRGDEKGYFAFGGSTCILLCPPGAMRPHEDILAQTAAGVEVLVRAGESIARR